MFGLTALTTKVAGIT